MIWVSGFRIGRNFTAQPAPWNRDRRNVKSKNRHNSGNTCQKSALNTALRILTRRDHSRYELIRKLKQRGFGREDIDEALSSCERLDYINDERTARIYIRQLKRKGYGKKRIQLELRKKGLRGDPITSIVEASVSEADEREAAERIVKKNLKRFEREKDLQKRRDKIYRFLLTRGYSREVITETIKSNG